MYSDNLKKIGEHTSVAEELLFKVPELEQKCRAVEKSVKEGYFTLQEALRNYKVSEAEYIPYYLLRNNRKIKRVKKQDRIVFIIGEIISVFDIPDSGFNVEVKQVMNEIKRISNGVSSNKKILVK